jgi:hypothetical protein
MRRRLVLAVLVAMGLVASGAAALAAVVPSSVPEAGGTFDLVGTWTGDYRYPLGTDEVVDATETLVIERQDGRLVWGVDEYTDEGQLFRIPVRGSIDGDGRGFAIAEENGFFLGEILGPNRVRVRFVRTDDQFTSFEVVLRRR